MRQFKKVENHVGKVLEKINEKATVITSPYSLTKSAEQQSKLNESKSVS